MQKDTKNKDFHILALTGGGYRGLFTACVLELIEANAKRPVGQLFELVTGTSIGGIIALAVAFEIPMNKVVSVLKEHGPIIFPLHKPRNRISKFLDYYKYRNKPRYDAESLIAAIEDLLPPGTTLGQALHPVIIPTVNLTGGRPQVFKTCHHKSFIRDWKLSTTDIALATSAAPTFFPLAELDNQLYADGGLFANAPEMLGIHEAEHYLSIALQNIHMLSIGTTSQKYSLSFNSGKNYGIGQWIEDAKLFSVTISAQQQLIEQMTSHRLGERYLKIDAEPSEEQARDLGLDIATQAATKTLVALGRKTASDLMQTKLKPYLDHEASNFLIKT